MMTQKTSTVKTLTRFMSGACSTALIFGWSAIATAQVTISDARTNPIDTQTEGDDVIIDTQGSVTVTTTGPAITLNSNNDLTNNGTITIEDVDGATAVSLEGGADRNFTHAGTINVTEDFNPEDTDNDRIVDGPVAQGTGRTGILISGASPFEGNVTLAQGSRVTVEGNNSFGMNLVQAAIMSGDITNAGTISVIGNNSTGVNLAGAVNGNVENRGNVSVVGGDSHAYNISGDIQGGFVNSGTLGSNGFRFAQRIPFGGADTTGNEDLAAEDLLNGGSAVSISGNISGGVHFDLVQEEILDADGNGTGRFTTVRNSQVTQTGSAPAILIDGNGTPIAIGRVSAISDPTDANFNANLRFGFVNEGNIASQGVYNDFDATIISISDATIEGGVFNAGTLSVSTFRGPAGNTVEGVTPGTGYARAIVLGQGAIVDQINNIGSITAQGSEAVDQIFADSSNPLAPVFVQATAIDIAANATVGSLYNSGTIAALAIGRQGEVYVIKDASGSLNTVTNEGSISALAQNSDGTGQTELAINLVAIDVSNNTTGFSYVQQRRVDTDLTDDSTPPDPLLAGSIIMGSGDDSLIASAGTITGDVDFGAGNNSLALSGGTAYSGSISTSGDLAINVSDGASLALANTTTVSVSDAAFDATSSYLPTLDGATGAGTMLSASGAVSFADGAVISPRFSSILTDTNGLEFTLANASSLGLTDAALATLNTNANDNQSFLYNFGYERATIGGQEALVVTVDLRDPNASIANGGLGLDSAQAAAFRPALGAFTANTELGAAIANITNGADFNSAFNQLLPEFSAAAREFVLANVDGATGAVGSHLDTARRSPDKPGGAWIQEFAYFADRDLSGLSEQYRGTGFGMTGGFDTAFGPFHAVGVNLGFASTEIEDVLGQDEPLDVITIQAGVYAGMAKAMGAGELGLDLYAGGGHNKFEQERTVRFNNFFGRSSADYTGTHINASARAGYDVSVSERFWIRPALSLDYLRLSEKGYTETGDTGIALDVSSRTSDRASASAMLNFGAKFQGRRTWIKPSLRVGYRHAFINDPVQTEFGFAGLNGQRATIQSFGFSDSGVLVGFSIAAGSAYSSIGFDFDSDIRDGFIRHTGRVVVRLLF